MLSTQLFRIQCSRIVVIVTMPVGNWLPAWNSIAYKSSTNVLYAYYFGTKIVRDTVKINEVFRRNTCKFKKQNYQSLKFTNATIATSDFSTHYFVVRLSKPICLCIAALFVLGVQHEYAQLRAVVRISQKLHKKQIQCREKKHSNPQLRHNTAEIERNMNLPNLVTTYLTTSRNLAALKSKIQLH